MHSVYEVRYVTLGTPYKITFLNAYQPSRTTETGRERERERERGEAYRSQEARRPF